MSHAVEPREVNVNLSFRSRLRKKEKNGWEGGGEKGGRNHKTSKFDQIGVKLLKKIYHTHYNGYTDMKGHFRTKSVK